MSDHMMVFEDQARAQQVVDELKDDGFDDVQLLDKPMADGRPAWAVLVHESAVRDESRPVEQGLRDRFQALADEHGATYDPHPDLGAS